VLFRKSKRKLKKASAASLGRHQAENRGSGRGGVPDSDGNRRRLPAVNRTGDSSPQAEKTDLRRNVDTIQDSDLEFMRQALAEARKAERRDEVPVGAVLVKEGKVLARAHNRIRREKDPTGHAEMLVIRAAARRLKNERIGGTILYTTIEPCPMCAGAAVLGRVSRVVFGAPDSRAGAGGSLLNILSHPRLNHRIHVQGGVLEEECRRILQRFFQKKRERR
jgi:tRNA(adenine34) deaminase